VVFPNFVSNLQDVDSLGIVNLRYCGYVAVAKVNNIEKTIVNSSSIMPADITDQPEGGAHALNINRSVALLSVVLLVFLKVSAAYPFFWLLYFLV
jgi:hypothetical protein